MLKNFMYWYFTLLRLKIDLVSYPARAEGLEKKEVPVV